MDGEALGRGNRRRKKRKFFDEEGTPGGINKKRGSLGDEVFSYLNSCRWGLKGCKVSKERCSVV